MSLNRDTDILLDNTFVCKYVLTKHIGTLSTNLPSLQPSPVSPAGHWQVSGATQTFGSPQSEQMANYTVGEILMVIVSCLNVF